MADQIRFRGLVHDTWGFADRLASRGLNLLFAGPPGTGKTMAASVLANSVGVDLYAIDLSATVSKYIGETEKQLERIFAEAQAGQAMLLFDEADALFGKRTSVRDAHDRYANLETSYLLQKLEDHDGTVILATNLRKNMDDAFVRRLHATIDFPLPGPAERLRIWQRCWPPRAPRHPDIDLETLARTVEVSGGNIRNIVLAGAFLAAADGGMIRMGHLVEATRAEYRKLGKLLSEGELSWEHRTNGRADGQANGRAGSLADGVRPDGATDGRADAHETSRG
jgi:SpoVK/Ycf46/Vps4 family AAA+-type ATPase